MTDGLPEWMGSVSSEALSSLLALQGERDWLDYKSECDLSRTRDLVEVAKDLGAMMITGGYIVVGADDHGRPAGEPKRVELFDAARLHDKLAKYLPGPFEIRSATHNVMGQSYALVYVAPHRDGFCIFAHDGIYQENGKRPTAVFRAGEVFARHGTRSERWDQNDISLIRQMLRADADQSRYQKNDAFSRLQAVRPRLGGHGLWLGLTVLPGRTGEGHRATPDDAQQFLGEWQRTQYPIEGLSLGTATYRQPGGIVVTNQASVRDLPHWWRLALDDDGSALGSHVLTHEIAGDPIGASSRWYGLSTTLVDDQTIPVRRDEVEIHLLTLLDVLTAHCVAAGAGGQALVMAVLAAPRPNWTYVAMLDTVIDDDELEQGWRLASARARLPLAEAVMVPVSQGVPLADMRDTQSRLRVAYQLAADLLAIFGIDQPEVITPDGQLNPNGAGIDHDQMVYQHARYLNLPVSEISPSERRERYKEAIKAAKDELRQR